MRTSPTKTVEFWSPVLSPEDRARFMAKVDQSGDCWRWTGATNGVGYGQFHLAGPDGRRQRYAHRIAYGLFIGPIPDGMSVDHLCENGRGGCVTPSHLELVPIEVNVMRSSRGILAQKARQTHCVRGHPLSGDNLYVIPHSGRRACNICRAMHRVTSPSRSPERLRESARRYRERKRLERS